MTHSIPSPFLGVVPITVLILVSLVMVLSPFYRIQQVRVITWLLTVVASLYISLQGGNTINLCLVNFGCLMVIITLVNVTLRKLLDSLLFKTIKERPTTVGYFSVIHYYLTVATVVIPAFLFSWTVFRISYYNEMPQANVIAIYSHVDNLMGAWATLQLKSVFLSMPYVIIAIGLRTSIFVALIFTLACVIVSTNKNSHVVTVTRDIWNDPSTRLILAVLWSIIIIVAFFKGYYVVQSMVAWYINLFGLPVLELTSLCFELYGDITKRIANSFYTYCDSEISPTATTILPTPGYSINHLTSLSLSSSYMDWHTTAHLAKGYSVCDKMLASLSVDSPLRSYLEQHCLHLTSVPDGVTPLSIDLANPSVLMQHPHTIALGPKYSLTYTRPVNNAAGIYVFFTDDEVLQCGSSISYKSRISTHYQEAPKSHKAFYVDSFINGLGLGNYHWVPLTIPVNYAFEYQQMHPFSTPQERFIIDSFTRMEVRALEQAYSSFVNPTYYQGIPVNLWHTGWTETMAAPDPTGNVTSWVNRAGETFTVPTISEAARVLDLSHHSLIRVANCVEPHFIKSPTQGEVAISITGRPEQTTPKGIPEQEINLMVDKSVLVPNKLYLYDDNMEMLPHGPYNTITDANEAMGYPRERSHTYRFVNTMVMVEAPILGISAYLVMNKVSKSMPVVVTNIKTGIMTNYPAVYSAHQALQATMSRTSFTQSFLVNGKIFNDTHKVEFLYPEDHIATKQRILNDKKQWFQRSNNR